MLSGIPSTPSRPSKTTRAAANWNGSTNNSFDPAMEAFADEFQESSESYHSLPESAPFSPPCSSSKLTPQKHNLRKHAPSGDHSFVLRDPEWEATIASDALVFKGFMV